MPDTPYCPLLSINKDVPVLCQEELCMWYVKQLKLCSITVQAYTSAMGLQMPIAKTSPTPSPVPQAKVQVKQDLTSQSKKQETKANPFALDDLD
ncbi:MAG: hypothetical protein HYY52_08350 [Candidatus Melainabacteria bacterium]|nr:hypothetical protein [Candidatus Melainabacteria bacterium]